MRNRMLSPGLPLLVIAFWLAPVASADVTFDWAFARSGTPLFPPPPGECDVQGPDCFGWVWEGYRISKTEVTNTQYAEFLNAVAVNSDPKGLYHTSMGSPPGGITRSAVPPYTYTVIAGRGNKPVNFVTFYDAIRFANWLHNGQPGPPAAQDSSTTEDGAYEITNDGISANSITRNIWPQTGTPLSPGPTARYFLPSEDEWYRAAYYDPVTSSFSDHPTGVPTFCFWFVSFFPYSNCESMVGDLTDVGEYVTSPSPLGTFDQGGNVSEWNEAIISTARGLRGGGFDSPLSSLDAATRDSANPNHEFYDVGFRVATRFIHWVDVRHPNNAADPATGYGSVGNAVRISETEVTNAQYAVFLNAVAAADPNGLYDTSMGTGIGGITRDGTSPSYSYEVIAGRDEMPVNYVSYDDAIRFANWMHNDQPSGPQDSTTTEDGAYAWNGTSFGTRNATSAYFLPSENEWYKAAYYKGSAPADYFAFPAGSSTFTTCASPSATPNTANCLPSVGGLTAVGSYTAAASPEGTFDQGGNVWEWNEGIVSGSQRCLRGGAYDAAPNVLNKGVRIGVSPTSAFPNVGFRVGASSVTLNLTEEFRVPSLGSVGIAVLCSLLGLSGSRRLRARLSNR